MTIREWIRTEEVDGVQFSLLTSLIIYVKLCFYYYCCCYYYFNVHFPYGYNLYTRTIKQKCKA